MIQGEDFKMPVYLMELSVRNARLSSFLVLYKQEPRSLAQEEGSKTLPHTSNLLFSFSPRHMYLAMLFANI